MGLGRQIKSGNAYVRCEGGNILAVADAFLVNGSPVGATTPGGSTTQLQRNNAGAFGGITGATSDGTNVTFGSANLIATRPKFITSVDDTNGNEIFDITATASAVNQLVFENAATGTHPCIKSAGGDTNPNVCVTPKGTGSLQIRQLSPLFELYNTAGGFLALQIAGPLISSQGGQDLTLRSNGSNLNFADSNSAGHAIFGSTILDVTFNQKIKLDRTITAGGTTGAQTINKLAGTVNFAAAATTLVVTKSLVDNSSIVYAVIRTADATAAIKSDDCA